MTANVLSPQIYGGQDEGLRNTSELEKLFRAAYSTKYTEFTYSGDDLTTVEVWETSGKLIKLFTRALSYTGDDLTQAITTDYQTGVILTVDLTYAGDDLTSTTKVVS